MKHVRHAFRGYLIALLATALVVLVRRYLLGEVLGPHAPLLLFVIAVMTASWSGGLKPGLFATVIGAAAGSYFFIEDAGMRTLQTTDQMRIIMFAIAGVLVSWLSESLHVARRRLEEADRRKDEFLATLAHELRNPLAPLSNALQLWPFVANDRTEMEKLRSIMERQVKQMVRLIDDLMDVSRITRGRIDLRKQRLDVGALVSTAVETVQPYVHACGHELVVTLPTEPILIEGDLARLIQVVGNVLHNAAKYTARNGTIWITAEKQSDKAVVRIRDNGPGIPAPMLSEIFEMFCQVDQTLDRAQGGLGIGLTLVKRLVEMHGGSVEVRSEGPGRGSEFTIALPSLALLTNGQQKDTQQLPQLAAAVPQHRILVVDDMPATAETQAMLLRAIGQEVHVVYDGLSAIESVITNKPDVVFLDIAMPGINGYEIARRLRAQTELRGLRLVALTGHGQPEDRRMAIAAGFDEHMTKPASLHEMEELLVRLPVDGE